MKTIYDKLLFLMLLLPVFVYGQGTVEGTVVDKVSKQPLPGVNVLIQGAANGTQTDFDGKFKLNKVKKGEKIVFSYVGYVNSTVTYDGQTDLAISLQEESNQLQEVVIQVGYGATKKKDATGSVALITAKDFNKGAIVSVDQLLAGKAAGVRITSNGGQPDAAPNIRIRGGASLSASNNPLIIVDGVPISDLNPAGVSNPFTLINPNDVESFSILKDASATAIYGVRASNGVILITTKKGTAGKPQFNYSSSFSVGEVTKKIDVMSGNQFVSFIKEYHPDFVNNLGIDDPTNDLVDNPLTEDIEGRIISNTDWQDQIYRTSLSSDFTFSARANLYNKIPFRASIGANTTQGLVKENDYKRLSYSLKMTPKFLNDDLKIDINAKGTYVDKNDVDEGGAIGGAIAMDPTKPVYGSPLNNRFGGYYQEVRLDAGGGSTPPRYLIDGAANPLALLEQRTRPNRTIRFLGNIEFDYKMFFLKELRAVVNLGLDASQSRIRTDFKDNAIGAYAFDFSNSNPDTNFVFNTGLAELENQTSTNTTMDAYLAYTKNLEGFVSRIDVQGGYSYQDFVVDGNKAPLRNNINGGVRETFFDPTNPNQRYYLPLNLQAFFGRANIDLKSRYLFTFTYRAEGSSLFAEDKRWGYFPAAGAAWKIKEEVFLKDVEFVQELKVRVGWGKTGQASIAGAVGYFPTRPFFVPGNINSQYFGGNITTYTARQFDPNITWEKSITSNIGLDFEFFKKGLVSGSFDAYKRTTDDLLAVVPVLPGQSLGSNFIKNVGSIESEGYELNLNVKLIESDKLQLSVGGNLAYNYSEVSDLNGIDSVVASESGLPVGTGVVLAAHAVGQEAYSAWVWEQVYDSNGKPIFGTYVDRNSDGKIDNEDRYYKALRPNWTYGFNTTFNYKNWDFVANFRGQIGGQVYNSRLLTTGFTERAVQGTTTALNNVLDFYGGAADPNLVNQVGDVQFSDYFLEDASFLRCDNVTLGYKFNKFIKTSSLRVYTSVNNAFIITKYSGQDPENFNAIDNNFYPRPRIYTIGLSLDF